MGISLGHAILALRADVRGLRMDMGSAERIVSSSLSNMGRVATSAFAAMAIAETIKQMHNLASAVVSVNDRFDRMHMTLGVVLKDQVRANALIKDMQKFAAETPFNTANLMEAFQLLRNYGMETRKILPALQSIGDAAAASPRGMEFTVHRIALAIGQMKSQGKLMGQELRQLAEAGVGADQILRKHFGKSIKEIQAMVKAGTISIDDVIDALLNGMSERFGGTMEKLSRSWSGLWERIRDKAAIATREITQPLFDLMRSGLARLADMFDSKAFQQFASSARSAMQSLTGIGGAISQAFAPLGSSLASAFRELSPLIKEIAADLEPVVRMVLEFAGSVAKKGIIGLAHVIDLVVVGIKELLTQLAILTTDFDLTWQLMSASSQHAFESMRTFAQFLWDSLKTGASNASIGIIAAFMQLGIEIKNVFTLVQTFVTTVFSGLMQSMAEMFAAVKKLMSVGATDLPNALVEFKLRMEQIASNGTQRGVAAGNALRNGLAGVGGAPGRIAAAPGRAINALGSPMPTLQESDLAKQLRRKVAEIYYQMTTARQKKIRDRRVAGQNAAIGQAIGGGLNTAGGMIAGLSNGIGGAFFGALDKAKQMFGGKKDDDKKRAKAEFVGLAEMSKRIQQGILDSDEKKDRKAMVKGIGAIGQGVQAVHGAVNGVVDAIKGWLPKAT